MAESIKVKRFRKLIMYLLFTIIICVEIGAQELDHEFESAKSRQRRLKDDEFPEILDKICKNGETEWGLKQLAQCVVQYSPKKLLIMMEYCKRKVYGNVKFDVILKGYCDDGIDQIIEWCDCQEDYAMAKYKKDIMEIFKEPENQKYRDLQIKCMTMDLENYKGK